MVGYIVYNGTRSGLLPPWEPLTDAVIAARLVDVHDTPVVVIVL